MSGREPERFGEFLVDGVLGRGGMGTVYSATHPDGRRAAIKAMIVKPEEEERHLARFEREASLRLAHPNVIRVLDSGYDDEGRPYIAFERLEGMGLDQFLRRERPTLAEALRVALDVTRGLEAVHAAGIVHRDLKPGNVFLCADGPVKVLDFGVAHLTDLTTDLTQGAIVGTPSYLSPEQARAQTAVDGRADIWATGVLLYVMLTGKRPFRRDSPLTTMMAVVMDEPAPLSVYVRHVPDTLDAIVRRCLQKRRGARFQTATELREALEAVSIDGPAIERVAATEGKLVVDIEIDDSAPTEVTRPSAVSIAEGEQRLVAVVLATGLRDDARFDDLVTERGGSVLRFRGRQAIAVFGLHEWEGDEIQRAGRAALAVRPLCKAVAVAAGRAFQRGHGVAGAALDRAELGARAQLEGVAASVETVGALGELFQLRQVDANLHEIVEETVAPATTPERAAMHGRQSELDALTAQLSETLEGGVAGAAVVVGPLGIGKTRLRQAFANAVTELAPDARILLGRADPRRRDVAMQLLSSVLQTRAWLGNAMLHWPDLSPAATLEERRSAVTRLVREAIVDEGLARACSEVLGELLGVAMPESTQLRAARRDPQLMADRVRVALTDYFSSLVDERPLVLVLEDLQWTDDASMALLEDLLEELALTPMFVLATGRPELDDRFPGLLADRGAQRITMGPLRPAAALAMARDASGRDVSNAQLKPLIQRADGNPLFILEIIRALSATSASDAGDETTIPLPPSVEAAVQARLDRVPEHEREALRFASILQRPVTEDELHELGIDDPGRALAGLARRGVLAGRQRVGGRGREFRFRSTLLAEVAQGSISPELRSDLHRRAALQLGQGPEPDPEEVAFHWEAAGSRERAGSWYARAAMAAERRGDVGEVLRCADRSVALGLPDALVFTVQLARADALRFTGDREAQQAALLEALESAKDDTERATALTELGYCRFRLGLKEEAFTTIAEAVDAARGAGDDNLLALALRRDVTMRVLTGDTPTAEQRYLEAARLLLSGGAPLTQALLAECEGLLANAMGDVGRQMLAFREAARLYEELGDLRRAAGAASNVADAYNRLGDFASAEQALRDAVAKCRRVGNRSVEGYALVNLGYALTGMGRTEDADAALDQAGELAEANSDSRLAVAVEVYRARNVLARSVEKRHAMEASELADEAAKTAERLSMNGERILALTLAAKAMLHVNLKKDALARSTEAMALRDRIGGAQEDEADVFLTHARALAANGDTAEAQEVIRRGRARVEEVASRIADMELRHRFLSDVRAIRELFEG